MSAHKQHSPGFLALVEEAKTRVRELTVAQTLKAVNGGSARLIDVREDSEWAAGHAKGADHLGKGIIERDIETLVPDRDAELILYCGGGYRAALAADSLQKMGYTNVASMAGGWRAWLEANGPVEEE
jgi:rhodanese-related sulfurtransferase